MRPKCRILIVDDYLPIRRDLNRLLALEGDLEVVGEASDGKEALELVAASRPDVVLLDLKMPKMNGIDAANMIRASWPQTIIIGLCSFQEAYTTDIFLKAGAVAVLTKDSVDQLVPTIRRACPAKTFAGTVS